MKSHLRLQGILATLFLASVAAARAESWIFQPSYFSHSPDTGERVTQYAPPAPSFSRSENYLQSGYRHHTIDIPGVGGGDHIHVVETWGLGDQIRPYGEWLRPYRPGATPFGPWGYPPGAGAYGPNPYGPGRGNPAYPNPYAAVPYGAGPYGAGPYGAGAGPGAGIGPGAATQSPNLSPYAAPGAAFPQSAAPAAPSVPPSGASNVDPTAPGAQTGTYRSPYGPPLLSAPRNPAPPVND